jgi:hypothetical protein
MPTATSKLQPITDRRSQMPFAGRGGRWLTGLVGALLVAASVSVSLAQSPPAEAPQPLPLPDAIETVPAGEPSEQQSFVAAHPECRSFFDGCVICRRLGETRLACSTPGIACHPAPWSCQSDPVALPAPPAALPPAADGPPQAEVQDGKP